MRIKVSTENSSTSIYVGVREANYFKRKTFKISPQILWIHRKIALPLFVQGVQLMHGNQV